MHEQINLWIESNTQGFQYRLDYIDTQDGRGMLKHIIHFQTKKPIAGLDSGWASELQDVFKGTL